MGKSKTVTDKIQLVKCSQDCNNFKLVLAEINRFYREAEEYHYAKEYQFSIFSLAKAFANTFKLKDIEEQDCAKFFRLIITESLNNINQELRIMTSGFSRNQKYRRSYLMAKETLELFKKVASGGKLRDMMNNFDVLGNLKSDPTVG